MTRTRRRPRRPQRPKLRYPATERIIMIYELMGTTDKTK